VGNTLKNGFPVGGVAIFRVGEPNVDANVRDVKNIIVKNVVGTPARVSHAPTVQHNLLKINQV
jgi:hypothetical protein